MKEDQIITLGIIIFIIAALGAGCLFFVTLIPSLKRRQIAGVIICILAVLCAGCVVFLPALNEHLLEAGYSTKEASKYSGTYGFICLALGVVIFPFGLLLINKWLPTIILATWYAHKYARSDDEDDEDY